VYDNRQILAVIFWAVLHDRPISWACQRDNWPPQAWRRALPDQSTLSRRMRDPALCEQITFIMRHVQKAWPKGRVLLTDGKAFTVRDQSRDPDAQTGYVTGGYAKGYKLHVVIDDAQQVSGWQVHPMNKAESIVSSEIVQQMQPSSARLLIGDASYDSNRFYAAAAHRGIRLIAPRRKPHRQLGHGRQQHPHRLRSIVFTEQRLGWMWLHLRTLRIEVERFFSGLVSSGAGIAHLPTWVRRIHRCRLWIGAKLAFNAARVAHLNV